jgi:hypothetical protein
MDTRLLSRRALLGSLVGIGASATVIAQISKPEFVRPGGQPADPPTVLSGSDMGFRVSGIEPDGTRTGELVVRVDGKWVPTKFGMRVLR